MKAVVTWARGPLGSRHALDVDELGHVAMCGRWRPEARDISDGDGPRCPACVLLAGRDEESWRNKSGGYYASRSIQIAEKLTAGTRPVEIAAELGVTLNHVHKVAQRMRSRDEERRLLMPSRIRAMAAANPTWLRSAIARELGTTVQQVAQILGGVS